VNGSQQRIASVTLILDDMPSCPECNTRMSLIRIEPDKPGVDLRVFECRMCSNVEQFIVEFLTPG
jgi:hypothetical protein